MSTDHDKQDELQKMLALKRHETPPPRFFKGFAGQVMDRLHSPESLARQTWWQRLGLDIDGKPVLVCASGVAVCGLLLVGLIASLRVQPPKAAPPAPDDKTRLVVAPPATAQPAPTPAIAPLTGAHELPGLGDPVVVSEPSPISPIKLQPNRATLNPRPAGNGSGGK